MIRRVFPKPGSVPSFSSSGFQAAATTRVRSPLANPSIVNVGLGNSTELVLKVTPIAHAKCYEVRSAAVCAGNTPGLWQTAGLFTNSRSMTINGLTPGTTYMFQVRPSADPLATAIGAIRCRACARNFRSLPTRSLSEY